MTFSHRWYSSKAAWRVAWPRLGSQNPTVRPIHASTLAAMRVFLMVEGTPSLRQKFRNRPDLVSCKDTARRFAMGIRRALKWAFKSDD